ncbi:MAG TPA: hypothetical protein VHW44_22875 [Pseudonocardiaceae bacterium]|jgi:hypothetical protein|nr:hypothetical protein [Pseudonocardiaceae bacterium]
MTAPLTMVVLLAIAALMAARRWIRDRRRAARATAPATTRRRGRKWSVVSFISLLLAFQVVIGIPMANADQCGEAPTPERPGAGMVGAIDPPSIDHGDPNSNYGKYSYAGTVWHVYQDTCALATTITDPNAVIDTWAGNEMFDIGKNIVGATNSLHYAMLSQDSMLKPLDNAVENAAQTFYSNIYVRWFAPVALILAVLLFRYVWTGDLASIGKRSMWALAGMWLAASVLVLGPVYGEVDSLLLQKTSQIQAGFLPSDQVDAQRNALPDSLYDNVVYNNWLRGEFGDPTSPQAKQYGPELLDDQAWTKLAAGSADDQAAVTAKQNDFKSLPAKLGSAAGFFEGSEGSRTGDGFLALLEGIAYSLFQLFAKASVLLAQVLIRILMLAAPLIGLAAMVLPELLPRVGKAAGAVLFNVLLLSAMAGMHALLLNLIFGAGNELSLLAQLMLAGLITLVFFMVGKPMRRMWQMVELAVGAAGTGVPSAPSVFSRLRGRSKAAPTAQDEFWDTVRGSAPDDFVGPGATAGDRDRRVRPEASFASADGSVSATAQRMDRRRREILGGSAALPGGVLAGGGPSGYGGPAAVPEAGGRARSRLVDSPTVVDRGWDRSGEDALVVPSQVTGSTRRRAAPRRAETEMVAGRPVFVLYRPSRGLEVTDGGWDARTGSRTP